MASNKDIDIYVQFQFFFIFVKNKVCLLNECTQTKCLSRMSWDVCKVSGGCLEGVWRVSKWCLKYVWSVSEGCLEDFWRVS